MVRIDWAGETFDLRAEKAALWARRRALVVADLHFGKSHHFRRAGVPVPHGTTSDALQRLGRAIDATGADELIILGDLFHARGGVTGEMLDAVAAWRGERRSLTIRLVTGNHDRHAGPPPGELGFIAEGDAIRDGDLELRHDPAERDDAFVIAGHVHPGIALRGRAGAGLRCPCFHFGRRVAMLPAFGAFTGLHTIRPRAGDRVVAVGPDRLMPVPTHPRAAAR